MFKKLKDKLAEEVKSSPQRIQQFAQAAQAAVTSASSSISDITNNDLFSITDNDNTQNNSVLSQPSPTKQPTSFQDVSLTQSPYDLANFSHDMETPRQRRLSNSSTASDVSFMLPSFENCSTYHIQSDMEVSASETDERGFSGGLATLDRVTKEQLYAAYKRTQERYTKYRNQYGDLARHYKLLDRECAKAKSLLVETQDKALRRISELKEQCSLEQSAKAHLEKAFRIELEEKALKIDALNTKINLLLNIEGTNISERKDSNDDVPLINLATDNISQAAQDEPLLPDITSLNTKIEKMEQLLNKYKESLKMSKDKNSLITSELQLLSNEIESKNKQIQELKITEEHLSEANIKIKELSEANEKLQNQVNAHDFTKIKELSTLEIDLQRANEEITELRSKINVFSKREEEYAISLAENKLSIHKELESKEAEIKSLKDSLSASKQEVQSLKIVLNDYKNSLLTLEEEKSKLHKDSSELITTRARIDEINSQLQELSKKCQSLEQLKTKADEEYKCLQLQLKQETAEKLAMIDRNVYLESRNSQLNEENTKKNTHINRLENELKVLSKENLDVTAKDNTEVDNLHKDLNMWKKKCNTLESEIQEEREELVKLQTEIEKLLVNHELLQSQNAEFRTTVFNLTEENSKMRNDSLENKAKMSSILKKMTQETSELRNMIQLTSNETKALINNNKESLSSFIKESDLNSLIQNSVKLLKKELDGTLLQCSKLKKDYLELQIELAASSAEKSDILSEKRALELKITQLSKELNTEEFALKNEVLNTKNAYEEVLKSMNALTEENETLHSTVKEMEIEKQTIQNSLRSLESDKNSLNAIILRLEEKLSKISFDLETVTCKLDEADKIICSLRKENIEQKNSEHIELEVTQEIQCQLDIEKANNASNAQLLLQKNKEINELNENVKNIENKNTQLLTQFEEITELHQASQDKMMEMQEIINKLNLNKTNEINQIQDENKTLCNEIEAVKKDFNKINRELETLKVEHETAQENVTKLNSVILHKSEDYKEKLTQLKELQDKCLNLSEENIKLKSEVSNFTSNIKSLESEIEQIKKSHTEIESEKERLNKIINELESKENQANMTQTKDTQTELEKPSVELVSNINDTLSVFENKWVLENKQSAMTNTASLNLKTNVQEDIVQQFTALKINNDTLKDDNRRLQSDIEGLQSYLTKISKENSVLNDKLREVIATSEHSMDDQLSDDLTKLKNELESGKEKINDLLRENSLLVEENLELKDQIYSQNYSKPLELVNAINNNHSNDIIKQKYDDLLKNNNDIKKQNMDLEQFNRSVSGNIAQLQEKNEKLKLSNEKLERRLDEALVSLRHLHSLSENTELEYLKNILYEYLTGTGAHSETLAKVLAAIVKFDDMQTQMVLQKERERQGFLRQLGII